MKVKCIDNSDWEKDFTLGKVYYVKDTPKDSYYECIGDEGKVYTLFKSRFEEVKEPMIKLNIPTAQEAKEKSVLNRTNQDVEMVECAIKKALELGNTYCFISLIKEELKSSLREMGYEVRDYANKTRISWS